MSNTVQYSVEKPVYVVAGLPRSGSTLLMNILGQNPRFHVTPTSGVIGPMVMVRNEFDKSAAFRAMPFDEREAIKLNMLRGLLNGAFAHSGRPVAIDKNRIWLEYLELFAAVLGGRGKVRAIVTVRDLRDVLASFEARWRDTAALSQPPFEQQFGEKARTALGRMALLLDDNQPVGRAFTAIRDAVARGWRENMHFVEYQSLTNAPERTIAALYAFLGETPFQHDFENVEQLTQEDDTFHGYRGLHTIRQRVEPSPPLWSRVYDRSVTAEPIWAEIEKKALFWRQWIAKPAEGGPA